MDKNTHEKNYENDIYLMIPLADNQKNWRLDELGILQQATQDQQDDYSRIPDNFSRRLLCSLQAYLEYECSNAVVDELRMAYLGEFSFVHSTDDYPKKGQEPEVIGTSPCQMILTAHHATHMYILTLVLPKDTVHQFSTTQVLDQISHESLWITCPKDGATYLQGVSKKYTTMPTYVSLYDYLKYKYGLLKCGAGKAFLLLSDRPSDETEFHCMMAGETYDSIHQDFHIASDNISQICNENHAQYDYYEVYMSEMVVACIMKNFSDDMDERIDITATYAFIVILAMFQNTSIEKVNMQISNALANDGDISHEEILSLYRNFGKTVRFWEKNNYKYWGTQQEAACIVEAFGNKELKETYYEHQEFLEHIAELKSAKAEERNGFILNIVATILAVIQVQDFIVSLLEKFYGNVGINVDYATSTFSTLIICGTFSFVVVLMIINRMRIKMRKGDMHIKELRDENE